VGTTPGSRQSDGVPGRRVHVDASPPLFAEVLRLQLTAAGLDATADEDCPVSVVTPDRRNAVHGRLVLSLDDGATGAVTVERDGTAGETLPIHADQLPHLVVDLTRSLPES
jgi:hypothetical protein